MSSSKDVRQSSVTGAQAMFKMGPTSSSTKTEGPTMRSLVIGGTGAPLLQRPSTFGKPPPLCIQRPRSISQRNGSVGLKQVWDSPFSSWNISNDDLEPLPMDFPLERSHRYIRDADAQEVALRISKALKAKSIQAEFKTTPPKAKCKTQDFVSFRIRLYAGDESGSPVVVEVQRRNGPSSCFMHACRAVLNAAEGKADDKPKTNPFLTKPVSQMKCLQDVAFVSEDESEPPFAALVESVAMIRSKQLDTNVLGLENLCSLMDPIKTNTAVALNIANSVAFARDNVDIRDDLIVMIERDVFSSPTEDIAISNHGDLLRQLSLTIFANCFALCANNESLSSVGDCSWFSDNLLPCLVNEIKRARTDACCASQAVTCAHLFAASSASAKEFLLDQGICEALRKANEYGVECHELLAVETERCLNIFAL